MNGKIYLKSLATGCLGLALTLGTGLSAQQGEQLHKHKRQLHQQDQQPATKAAKSEQVPKDVRKLIDDLHAVIREEHNGKGGQMDLIHHLMLMLHKAIGKVHGQHGVHEIHEAHQGQHGQKHAEKHTVHEQHSRKHAEKHTVHEQHAAKHNKHEKSGKKVQVH